MRRRATTSSDGSETSTRYLHGPPHTALLQGFHTAIRSSPRRPGSCTSCSAGPSYRLSAARVGLSSCTVFVMHCTAFSLQGLIPLVQSDLGRASHWHMCIPHTACGYHTRRARSLLQGPARQGQGTAIQTASPLTHGDGHRHEVGSQGPMKTHARPVMLASMHCLQGHQTSTPSHCYSSRTRSHCRVGLLSYLCYPSILATACRVLLLSCCISRYSVSGAIIPASLTRIASHGH